MKSVLIYAILLLSVILSSTRTYAQDADVQDSLALVDLYNSTNGPGWTDKVGWLAGPVSNWDGVNLNGVGKVITLNLVGNNLKGTLPATIKKLTACVDFELQSNQLSGTIPDLTGMAALNTFFLQGNQLTGSIPASIGTLTNLSQIYLSNNKLNGSIPNLSALTQLNTLELENNQLTGSFPTLPGPTSLISYLRLSNNKLSGTLPAYVGGVQFTYFDIDHNQFSGALPAVFFTLVTNGCYEINISNNLFGAPLNLNTGGDCENFILDSNQFDFTGIENIAQGFGGNDVYAPQFPPMHVHFNLAGVNLVSVSAGGTVANNTYYWYRNGLLAAYVLGDSTYFATMNCGDKWSCYVVNNFASQLTLYSDTLFTMSTVPSVSILASANNICSGKSVTFTATPTNGGTAPSYQWKLNGNNVGTNSATFTSVTLANNDQVTVVLTNNDGCAIPATATSNKITMVVNPSTQPTFTQIGPLCQNATAPALPSTSKEGTAGTWNPLVINTAVLGTKGYIFTPTGAPCALRDTMNITITASAAPPTFDQIGPLCQNSAAPALPATSKEGTAGTWNPLTINTATVGSSTYTFTPSGGSCSVQATMSITISPKVTPTFDPIGPLCQNSTAPALPATSKEGIAGTWNPLTINTATVGTGTYTFTPGGGGSCSVQATMSITISSKVTPTFDPIGPLCQNSTAPALPATSKEGIAGTWNPLTINTATLGAGTYTFTPGGGGSCSVQATMSITISSKVTPTFDPIGPLCQNSTAPALPATSKEGIAGTWNPLTINTATLGTGTYTFTPSGSSCSVQATMSITIAASTPAPTFDPIGPLCQNSTAPALPATSKEGIPVTWNPLTINTATVGSSNYVFTPSGGGSCSVQGTLSITISSKVTPTFDPIGPLCQNSTAPALPATSKEGIAGTWNPLTINTATLGTGTYTFTPGSGGSCSVQGTLSITISSTVTPTFDPIGPLCQNSTAPALPATSKEGIAGTWNPLTINTATLGTGTYTFTPGGGGSCSVQGTMSITISSKVTPTFDQIGPLCQNSTAPVLPATSKEGTAGTWNPLTINTATLGTGTYTFTPSGGGSCSVQATMSITISTKVTPTFNTIDPLCQNVTAPALPGSSKEGISGTWSPSAISTAVVGSADYTFTPSAGQCGTTAKITVVVNAIPIVKTGPDQTITAGETVGLTATVTGISQAEIQSYQWSPPDGLSSSSIAEPQASPAATTIYTLTVTSDAGCKASNSTTINVQAGQLPPLGIPNAFSPNGDGVNDTWVITNISYYPDAQVSVFNRYGHLIYQTQGAYTPWDGNYDGKKVPFGTYYYIIDTKDNTKKKTGYLTIVR